MKLSELRVAVRAYKGNPAIVTELIPNVPMTLVLQKTVFLEELARVYANERTAETGLVFEDATGILRAASTPTLHTETASPQDDEDIL
jgi:hypothetical protein